MTAGERQALTWLLAVIAIGAGVRMVGGRGARGAASPEAADALRMQLAAVDSAQRAAGHATRTPRRPGRGRRGRPVTGRDTAIAPALAAGRQLPTLAPVDVDVADSAALERLPRIGPSLAARIVADRQKKGAFGSAAALQRVRGIGPKLSARLAPLVTFSGTPRPSVVQR